MSHYHLNLARTRTRTHVLNACLLVAWIGLMAVMQQLDADPDQALADEATQAPKAELAQRRERLTRQSVCLRTTGPATEPAELPDGTYTCRMPTPTPSTRPVQVAAR